MKPGSTMRPPASTTSVSGESDALDLLTRTHGDDVPVAYAEGAIGDDREIAHGGSRARTGRSCEGHELAAVENGEIGHPRACRRAVTPALKAASWIESRLMLTFSRAPARAAIGEGFGHGEVAAESGGNLDEVEALLHGVNPLHHLKRHFGRAVEGFFDERSALGLGALVGEHHLVEGLRVAIHGLGEEAAVLFEGIAVEFGQAGHHRAERGGHGGRGGRGAAAARSGGRRGQRVEELGKSAARGQGIGDAVFEDQLGTEVLVAQESTRRKVRSPCAESGRRFRCRRSRRRSVRPRGARLRRRCASASARNR